MRDMGTGWDSDVYKRTVFNKGPVIDPIFNSALREIDRTAVKLTTLSNDEESSSSDSISSDSLDKKLLTPGVTDMTPGGISKDKLPMFSLRKESSQILNAADKNSSVKRISSKIQLEACGSTSPRNTRLSLQPTILTGPDGENGAKSKLKRRPPRKHLTGIDMDSNDERNNRDMTPIGSVAPSVSPLPNAMSIIESSSGLKHDDRTSSQHKSPEVSKPHAGRENLLMTSKSGLANIIEEDIGGSNNDGSKATDGRSCAFTRPKGILMNKGGGERSAAKEATDLSKKSSSGGAHLNQIRQHSYDVIFEN